MQADNDTLVDVVEGRLRDDIINGLFPARSRLGIEALRQRYRTGATPVREALSRLLAEGIVHLNNNRGFWVPPLAYSDLYDLSRARALIEGAAVREAAERGDDEWEAGLAATFHLLQRRAGRDLGDPIERQSYYDAHHAFHAALLAGCESPRLMAMQSRLERQHSRYYRQLPFDRIAKEDLVSEHKRVLDVALSRNAEALEELIRRHVMLTVDRLPREAFHQAFECEPIAVSE